MEHGFFIVYLPTKNDEFSKAMLVYQRVYDIIYNPLQQKSQVLKSPSKLTHGSKHVGKPSIYLFISKELVQLRSKWIFIHSQKYSC